MKLVELLKRSEGKTLEYKRDLSSPEGVLKSLVAFANTAAHPYHSRGSDTQAFAKALEGTGVEVRLRNWYGG